MISPGLGTGLRRARRLARRILRRPLPLPTGSFFEPEDIDRISALFRQHGAARGTPWDALRDSHMTLPSWFRHGLDPLGDDYAAQQHRLWQLVSGVERPYDPDVDEREGKTDHIDPIRQPGFYGWRHSQALPDAADHVLACGMVLKHCGLTPGEWALEYGAGFAQIALTMARLGVNVDTVDISRTYTRFVAEQAQFFGVPLHAFHGRFGDSPRAGQRYRLIFFYESFHHCVDFRRVVHRLDAHLAEGGRIVLAGEPIVEREYAAVPYPWGVRLHSEVVAVMRQMHWFELGFSENFLYGLFAGAGFEGRRIDCEPSLFGRLYVFERQRSAEVKPVTTQ